VSHLGGLSSRILMNPRVGMEVLIACSVLWGVFGVRGFGFLVFGFSLN
jgi:hypothetical protein